MDPNLLFRVGLGFGCFAGRFALQMPCGHLVKCFITDVYM